MLSCRFDVCNIIDILDSDLTKSFEFLYAKVFKIHKKDMFVFNQLHPSQVWNKGLIFLTPDVATQIVPYMFPQCYMNWHKGHNQLFDEYFLSNN